MDHFQSSSRISDLTSMYWIIIAYSSYGSICITTILYQNLITGKRRSVKVSNLGFCWVFSLLYQRFLTITFIVKPDFGKSDYFLFNGKIEDEHRKHLWDSPRWCGSISVIGNTVWPSFELDDDQNEVLTQIGNFVSEQFEIKAFPPTWPCSPLHSGARPNSIELSWESDFGMLFVGPSQAGWLTYDKYWCVNGMGWHNTVW